MKKFDVEKVKPIAKVLLGENYSIRRIADDFYDACGFFLGSTMFVTTVTFHWHDDVQIHIRCSLGDERRLRLELEKILTKIGFSRSKPIGKRFNLGYVYEFSRKKDAVATTKKPVQSTNVVTPKEQVVIPDNSKYFSEECKAFTKKILKDLSTCPSPVYTLKSCFSATDSAIPNEVAYNVGRMFKEKHYSVYLYYTWRSNTPYKMQISKHRITHNQDVILL